jgi:hypothetical protein
MYLKRQCSSWDLTPGHEEEEEKRERNKIKDISFIFPLSRVHERCDPSITHHRYGFPEQFSSFRLFYKYFIFIASNILASRICLTCV